MYFFFCFSFTNPLKSDKKSIENFSLSTVGPTLVATWPLVLGVLSPLEFHQLRQGACLNIYEVLL